MNDPNDTKTRLMTLLNVSHLKALKRKPDHNISLSEQAPKRVKLNQRRSSSAQSGPPPSSASERQEPVVDVKEAKPSDDEEEEIAVQAGDDDSDDEDDMFTSHFGPSPRLLTPESRQKVDAGLWSSSSQRSTFSGGAQTLIQSLGTDTDSKDAPTISKLLTPKLVPVQISARKSVPQDSRANWDSILENALQTKDIYLPHISIADHANTRKALSLAVLNHILRIRKIVMKNNDRIAAATSKNVDPPEDIRDQGFTRPSTLIIVPFRNSALSFIQSFLDHFTSTTSSTPSGKPSTQKTQEAQIHHYARFKAQYSLPEDAVDKLASAEPGTYPPDHVATFSGNIDDNFKIGVKITKRSVRLYEQFYGADLIVASPLGLRLAIEKDGDDFLSSIEMVVIDQIDSILMQNWDHISFIFQHLNKIPKDSHGADFSRIKPWYLDEHAAYVRQIIMLSQYDTPEARALFRSLKNVEGKIQSVARWEGVQVPEGVEQKFIKFESNSPRDEAEKRFDHFTKKLFPSILRSAVQSTAAVIFVPSYFDFVRVQNWMKKNGTTCAYLSEYSTPQDISRARQAFFAGSVPFLIITERFHFFRRYKIRGIRNIIFYGPPEHAQFYAEFLQYPFTDEGVEPGDVSVRMLYSKYDMLRLERIVGTEGVGALMEDA